jgi:protein O-mannosyl-transferase
LQQALALNPAHLETRLLLLDSYAAQGAAALLMALAKDTLKLAPNDPTVRRYAENKPLPSAAVPLLATAMPLPEVLLDLSLRAHQNKDFAGCIRFAQLALKQRPDYAEAYNNLTAAYNSLGRWDEAIRAGHEALRIRPDYELARNNLLWAESRQKLAAKRAPASLSTLRP